MKLLLVILIGAIATLGAATLLEGGTEEALPRALEPIAVMERETRRDPRPRLRLDGERRESVGVAVDWKPRLDAERSHAWLERRRARDAEDALPVPPEEVEPEPVNENWIGTELELANGEKVLHGDWVSYHDNGELDEQGAYDQGLEIGLWRWWYDNGAKKAVGNFVQGKREGPWSWWYDNGNSMMNGHYATGVGTGAWTLYHENGRIWGEGQYVNGEISGPWTFWTEDGSRDESRTGLYANGELTP